MSLTLDKLKALRRQAGVADAVPVVAVPATPTEDAAHRVSAAVFEATPAAHSGYGNPTGAEELPAGNSSAAMTPRTTPGTVGGADVGAAVGATLVATTTPAQPSTPASALDWIEQTIRHADPAALAARAHGQASTLRPSTLRARVHPEPARPRPATQADARGVRAGTNAVPPAVVASGHVNATTPTLKSPGATGPAMAAPLRGNGGAAHVSESAPLAAKTAAASRPASALDWIEQTIRHADPATLAARAHGQAGTLRPSAPRARVQPEPARPDPATPADAHGVRTVPPAVVAGGHANAATPVPKSPDETGPAMADHLPATDRAAHASAAGPLLAQTAAASSTAAEPPAATGLVSAAASRSPIATATGVITPRDVGALQRLLATRQRALPTPAVAAAVPVRRDLPGEEIAPGLWLQQTHVPMTIPAAPLSLAFARRPDDDVDPADLLFFDTETTGLAGGTGTRAFMIGAADFHDDPRQGPGLRVRQLLISTLGAESAMLEAFAGWLEPTSVLSSFNGRSYDAPLLKTRYRLARQTEPLSALAHIDLLHPARRRWRGQWENCRLATIERHVLGIERNDDLPGSQAPGAWLDHLRGGSSELLHRVAAHNHQDVVTLALLFQQLVSDARQDSDPAPPPLQTT